MKDIRQIELVTEDTVEEVLAGGDGRGAMLKLLGIGKKDLLATLVRIACRAIDPILVVHVSEAWMADMRVEEAMKPENRKYVMGMLSGTISLEDVPNTLKTECIIVRCETKSGENMMFKRTIVRGPDGKPAMLGPVQYVEDLEGKGGSKDCGRFSDFWAEDPEDGRSGMKAESVEIDPALSSGTWKY